MKNGPLAWNPLSSKTEVPPVLKSATGADPGEPLAAEHFNWLMAGAVAGANLDRREGSLLYLPLRNSLTMERGVGSGAFTRSSSATFVDRYGVLQTASVDTPRFKKKWLCEGASTNLLTQSVDMDTGWTRTRVTRSTDSTKAPDGTSDAVKLTEDGTAAGTHVTLQSASWTSGDEGTFSIFVKAGSAGRSLYIRLGSGAFPANELVFDPATGTAIGTPVGGYTIEALAGGWYGISVSSTAGSTAAADMEVFIYSNSAASTSYDGDSSSYIYVAFPQAEKLPFPTSFIPTTGTAATRTAESFVLTSSGNLPLQSDSWTIRASYEIFGISGAVQNVIDITGETTRALRGAGTAAIQFEGLVGDGSANKALNANQSYRVGLRFDGTDGTIWVDGVKEGEILAPDLSDTLGTQIDIGNGFYGYISDIEIHDYALSDMQMAVA